MTLTFIHERVFAQHILRAAPGTGDEILNGARPSR